MTDYICAALIGYALGCIQLSYILTRVLKKADIRSMGTGNSGASNTVGVLGWKYGILVGAFDIAKAAASVLIVKYVFRDIPDADRLYILLFVTGLFAIIGHNHPFYMRFRGGKGTASLIGMLAAIDIRIGLICSVVIILVTVLTDYIALGALSTALLAVVLTIVLGYVVECIAVMVLVSALSFVKHIVNLRRIIKGTEDGLRKALRKV